MDGNEIDVIHLTEVLKEEIALEGLEGSAT
jgi:hypothetical protein